MTSSTPQEVSSPGAMSGPSPEESQAWMGHVAELDQVRGAAAVLEREVGLQDTLIIINIPSGQTLKSTCHNQRFPSKFRLPFSSSVLRESGFARFPKLLDDTKYQARLKRRLNNKRETIPEGVQYFLDLGPTDDEDARAEQLEALSVPTSLKRWFLTAKSSLSLNPQAVVGHDDSCSCNFEGSMRESLKTGAASFSPPTTPQFGDGSTAQPTSEPPSFWDMNIAPAYRQIDDYCDIRHAANVIRLLFMMVSKNNILLDSAPRVYTIAGLAKIFELQPASFPFADRLRQAVCDWFYPGSFAMLEALPEASFKIAWNLKIPLYLKLSYRILVAEKVLADASATPILARRESVFGRPLDSIDEDIETVLQHASRSLADRISTTLQSLKGPDALHLLATRFRPQSSNESDIPTWQRLIVFCQLVNDAWPTDARFRAVGKAGLALWEGITKVINEHVARVMTALPERVMNTAATGKSETWMQRLTCYRKKCLPESNAGPDSIWLYNRLSNEQKALTSITWSELGYANLGGYVPKMAATYPYRYKIASLTDDFNTAVQGLHTRLMFTAIPSETGNVIARDRVVEMVGYGSVRLTSDMIFDELDHCMRSLCQPIYDPSAYETDICIALTLSEHLLMCLNDDELKFLPLWAGGLDDGSGGVFQEALPEAHLGPTGPGPAYHTGYTVATDDYTPSDLGFENLAMSSAASDKTETAQADSKIVQDSISTVYNPHVVVAASQSMPSETFSQDSECDYHEAVQRSQGRVQDWDAAFSHVSSEAPADLGSIGRSQQHGGELEIDDSRSSTMDLDSVAETDDSNSTTTKTPTIGSGSSDYSLI